MDGSGELFTEFLSYFDGDHLVIPLPEYGPQDHATLASIINKKLPNEDYILLAESFAGGIVPELLKLNPAHMQAVIFVASFLSSPNKLLLQIAEFLPIKTLASAPLSKFAHKLFFLGRAASKELLAKFVKVVKSIPDQVLKNRLEVIRRQKLPLITFDIPVIYIQALSDRLIPLKKSQEVANVFNNIEFVKIEGPHFILQTNPKKSALLINKLIQTGKL